jgi:hypothetical protein
MKTCLNCRRPNDSKFKRCARCREVARAYWRRHRKEIIVKSRAYRKTHRPQLAAHKRQYRWRKRVEVLWEQYWTAARALVAALTTEPRPMNSTPEVTQ